MPPRSPTRCPPTIICVMSMPGCINHFPFLTALLGSGLVAGSSLNSSFPPPVLFTCPRQQQVSSARIGWHRRNDCSLRYGARWSGRPGLRQRKLIGCGWSKSLNPSLQQPTMAAETAAAALPQLKVTLLQIEYVVADVPPGGCAVYACVQPTIPCPRSLEPAGHSFHEKALAACGYEVEGDNEETSDDDSLISDGNGPKGRGLDADELESFRAAKAGGPKPGAARAKRKKGGSSGQDNQTGNSEARIDLYKALGLENYRYLATDSQIKKAHQAAALKWHPDKHASASPEHQEKVKAKFQRIQLAFETLSNKQKRREYDSGEPFDESIPGMLDPDDPDFDESEFFESFGPVFKRNARWSAKKPIPDIGDSNSSEKEVDNFYKFWQRFQSWRELTHEDEYDLEEAECREDRRAMQRYNNKLREKLKKAEMDRIRRLVDNANRSDPRLRRWALERQEKRDSERKAKQEAKEAEEKAKREAEEEKKRVEQAEMEGARKNAKKEKERLKKAAQSERKQLRTATSFCDSLSENEVPQLCSSLSLGQLVALNRAIKECGEDHDAIRTAVLSAVKNGVVADEDAENLVISSPKPKATTNGETKGAEESTKSEDSVTNNSKQKTQKPWTSEELARLKKGLDKFPVGTRSRWGTIAEYVGRSEDEVLAIVKGKGESLFAKATGDSFDQFIAARGSIPDNDKDGSMPKNSAQENANGTDSESVESGPKADAEQWSKILDAALIKAMKTFPKELGDRWVRISTAVPGKSVQQCKRRAAELVSKVKQRSKK